HGGAPYNDLPARTPPGGRLAGLPAGGRQEDYRRQAGGSDEDDAALFSQHGQEPEPEDRRERANRADRAPLPENLRAPPEQTEKSGQDIATADHRGDRILSRREDREHQGAHDRARGPASQRGRGQEQGP